jgi:hypothetical protein
MCPHVHPLSLMLCLLSTPQEAALVPCRAALLDAHESMQGAASVSLMAVASAVKRQAARKALR